MQGHSFEKVGLDLSFKSNPQTTSPVKNQPHSIYHNPVFSALCQDVAAFGDINNPDHNTLIACLSLLSSLDLYNAEAVDLYVDILMRFNKALKNILGAPSSFSKKLEREWLSRFSELNILVLSNKRRPRSLEAVPSYDPMSPMRMSLTPRETVLSPKGKTDSPRISSPVKGMLQMKRFWQDGDNVDQEKEGYEADSSRVHAHSLDQ